VKKYILFDHDGVLVDTEFWYYKAGNAPWQTWDWPWTRISTSGT
jgi:beta-phosphoglucomutase-like phosphatase (HAD superfamily)